MSAREEVLARVRQALEGAAPPEPLLRDYVKTRATSSWGWYALGYTLFAQQKVGEAVKALARSLELDITNAEAHKILGRTLMIIGRFDADSKVQEGQDAEIAVDTRALHFFDPDTGLAIYDDSNGTKGANE